MKKMEKTSDFLYELTAMTRVTHDHLEDWFDEKSSVTNTLLKLYDNGHRLMQFIEKEEKDEKFIINEMMKFFRDAYFETEAIPVHSPELMDVKNEMADTARYWFWGIKKTALLAILTCGRNIDFPKEEIR
jgi:hypothetical protein